MSQPGASILLKQGIAAAKAGNKPLAQQYLLQVIEIQPENESLWVWLAITAGSRTEQIGYLQKALAVNPKNQRTRAALNKLQATAPPAKAETKRPSAAQPAKKKAAPPEKPKLGNVMIVDDSPTICKLVGMTLKRQGFKVTVAVDGMDALAKLNDSVPDLILLDITMPRMDGYQLCKIVKGNSETKNVPVVMLSGKDGFFDKVRGRMAGSTDYITKPFEPQELVKTVKRHIKS